MMNLNDEKFENVKFRGLKLITCLLSCTYILGGGGQQGQTGSGGFQTRSGGFRTGSNGDRMHHQQVPMRSDANAKALGGGARLAVW